MRRIERRRLRLARALRHLLEAVALAGAAAAAGDAALAASRLARAFGAGAELAELDESPTFRRRENYFPNVVPRPFPRHRAG